MRLTEYGKKQIELTNGVRISFYPADEVRPPFASEEIQQVPYDNQTQVYICKSYDQVTVVRKVGFNESDEFMENGFVHETFGRDEWGEFRIKISQEIYKDLLLSRFNNSVWLFVRDTIAELFRAQYGGEYKYINAHYYIRLKEQASQLEDVKMYLSRGITRKALHERTKFLPPHHKLEGSLYMVRLKIPDNVDHIQPWRDIPLIQGNLTDHRGERRNFETLTALIPMGGICIEDYYRL